jgi:hypothetical protein
MASERSNLNTILNTYVDSSLIRVCRQIGMACRPLALHHNDFVREEEAVTVTSTAHSLSIPDSEVILWMERELRMK